VTDLSSNLETARKQLGFVSFVARFNPEIDANLATVNSAYHLSLAATENAQRLATDYFLPRGW